ncbi:MAG: DUF1592 domain-containing protein [Verrucomicrobiales bacterium]|nr:DUF1592 domain-containing protein [Verrucomicrobiales bacterium]
MSLTALLSATLVAGEKERIDTFFADYCYKCHDADVQKGDVRLDEALDQFDVIGDRELWLSVIEQIETQEMPPKKPFPTTVEYEELVALLEEGVNNIDWEALKHPGHVTLPRLTQVEYNNTIRDLLGLDVQTGRFFSPDAEGRTGFTNDRDNLFVTGGDLEKYLEAADVAVASLHSLAQKPKVVRFEAEDLIMTESRSAPNTYRTGEEGYTLTSGQRTLYESITIPAYGFYRFRMRAASTEIGPATGLIRVDDVMVGEIEVVGKDFMIETSEAFLSPGVHQLALNVMLPPRAGRGRKESVFEYTVLPENAIERVRIASVEEAPDLVLEDSGGSELRPLVSRWNSIEVSVQRPYEWIRLLGEKGSPSELRRFLGFIAEREEPLAGLRKEISSLLGISLREFDELYRGQNPAKLRDRRELRDMAEKAFPKKRGFIAIDWVEIEGPVMPEQGSSPELALAANEALSDENKWRPWLRDFLSRAFRRPLEKSESKRYLALYDSMRNGGEAHLSAASQIVSAVLTSPKFLYRSEELPTGESGDVMPLDSYQLGSRLSYFLWNSLPDETLREAASRGELETAGGLKAQVARMLNDDRAEEFYGAFPAQWLGYEALGRSVIPDGALFPEFDLDLSRSMKAETRLLFQSVFVENRSILDLLSSEDAFLNNRLARHYGLPDLDESGFVRVKFTGQQSRERGGLLGMASVLTATSTPVRTSPVLRGVFVMERLLGDEPGEPPADAGELPGNAGARGMTLREELEIHRDKADCAVCHDKIDPLGFGLEGFDALGRIKLAKEMPKDTVGTLPDGNSFEGVAGLRDYLVEHRGDDFAQTVVERLLAYALGRELKVYDEPVVAEILEQAGPGGYRGRALVEAIVLSYPFTHQHRSSELNLPAIASQP